MQDRNGKKDMTVCSLSRKERKKAGCWWSLRFPLDHIVAVFELKFLSQKSLACGFGAEESSTLYRSKFICMICS
ncbi:hypothetical protein Peur_069043 [Populus x canadensis]